MSKSSSLRVLPGVSVANLSAQKVGPYLAGTPVPIWVWENAYSIALDGSNDYADTGLFPIATLSTALSASVWFYVTTGVSNETPFWLGMPGAGNYNRVKFHILWWNDVIQFRQGNGYSTSGAWFNSSTLTTGWHNAVFSDTATSTSTGICKFYLDNQLVGTDDPSMLYYATASWARSDIELGKWSGHSNYMEGNVDEVTLWDRALSAAEVEELYGGSGVGVPIDPTTLSAGGPIHWWRMGDEVSGTTVPDQVGSMDMTLRNGATTSTEIPT